MIFFPGFLVDFISAPVVSGFTSATSVIIIVAQLKGLLGLSFRSHGFLDTLWYFFTHVKDLRIPDATIGLSSMIFLLFFRVRQTWECFSLKKYKHVCVLEIERYPSVQQCLKENFMVYVYGKKCPDCSDLFYSCILFQ